MSLKWLEADWPAPPRVRVLSTLRGGGVSLGRYQSLNLGDHVGDDLAAVAENRALLRSAAQLPTEPSWLSQVHGVEIADLDGAVPKSKTADAAFTRRADVVCAILTADCLPVLFVSEDGRTVGAAHAGWRGLASGVIEATVKAMGLPTRQLLVWLAPCIGPRHFEVGGEVREVFLQHDPAAEACFQQNARGRFMADLAELARRRLRAIGVARIYGGGECTFDDSGRFFSHRRDGITGRQATLIWREHG